jgi:hypothetical protein
MNKPSATTRSIVIAGCLSLSVFIAASAASALDLASAGWSFNPASPGACPTSGSDFDCYENRTASSISIIGSDSSFGDRRTTFLYNLSLGNASQQVSFNYYFADASAQSIAYYQLDSDPRSLLTGAGSITAFTWNSGQTLTFGVDQNGFGAYAGELAITSFSSISSSEGEPVPAPLPMLGAAAAFTRARSLRRRSRASHS